MTRLAVLGSPIAHSQSPALHAAAYRVLGLDWRYEAVEVGSGGLEAFLGGIGPDWRGISLTMPLKREVLPLLTARDDLVDRVAAANTVLLADGARHGFNTDAGGIVDAFRERGVGSLDTVHVLGAGATAGSVLAAAAALGARQAIVSARDTAKARSLQPIADAVGVDLVIRRFGIADRSLIIPSAVVSTLPGGADADIAFPMELRAATPLFDIAYGHGTSAISAAWEEAGGTVIPGLLMLLHQAVRQVRVFVDGSPDVVLAREAEVVAAMRAAIGL